MQLKPQPIPHIRFSKRWIHHLKDAQFLSMRLHAQGPPSFEPLDRFGNIHSPALLSDLHQNLCLLLSTAGFGGKGVLNAE